MAADGSVIIDILGDASQFEKTLKGLAKGAVSGLTKAVAGVGTAMAAAGAGVVALAKQATEGYAEYEQLVGGVKTLFGTEADSVEEYAKSVGKSVDEVSDEYNTLIASQNAVLTNAANAFSSAGMSANEYMSTVTGFSASLLQSLDNDTQAAADKANQAIIDMADNANKMGTAIESIQDAYQGFAKQNYTMLDNLKLGYGGTKEEMERLLAEASAIAGVQFDIRSYADIIDAIHVIQTEMGITGTTALEASTTIQGSISSMRSAWQNFLTGMADENQDFDALLGNLVDSIVTVGENLIPRIQMLLPRLTEGLSQLAQALLPQIPAILDTLLPTLIEGAQGLIDSFVGMLPGLISTAVNAMPQLADAALSIVNNLVTAIGAALPQLLDAAAQIVVTLVNGIAESLPEQIPAIVDVIVQLVQTFIDNVPMLIDAGIALLEGLVQGILNAIPVLVDALPQVITSLIDTLLASIPQIIQAGIDLLTSLVDALPEIIDGIVAVIPDIISGVIKALIDNLPAIINAGIQLFMALVDAIPEIVVALAKAVPDIINAIVEGLNDGINYIVEVGKDFIRGLWEGIKSMFSWIKDKIKTFASDTINAVKNFFGIHSPSTLMRDEVGVMLARGLAEGIEKGARYAEDAADELGRNLTAQLEDINDQIAKSEQEALERQAEREAAQREEQLSELYARLGEAEEEERQSILDDIAQLQDDWNEEQLQKQEEAAREQLQAQADMLQSLQDEYQDALDQVRSDRDTLSGELADTGGLFEQTDDGMTLVNLQESIDQINAYGDAIAGLKERGISSGLLQEILAMDPEDATAFANQLLSMGDDAFAEYLSLWEEKESAAERVASEVYAGQLAALEEVYTDQLPDAMKQAGEDASDSLKEGIEAKTPAVVAAAASLAAKVAQQFDVVTGFSDKLRSAVEAEAGRVSAGLTVTSAAPSQERAAETAAQAARTAGMLAMASAGTSREVVLAVNGIEFGRAIMPDWRAVEDQSPRIVSDRGAS